MKTSIRSLIAALCLCASVVPLHAQTTNAPGNILQTAATWLTSQNTNLAFANVSVWDGPVYISGSDLMNEFGASYDLWRQNNTNAPVASSLFDAIEGRTRQLPGVGTPFVSQAIGDQFGVIKWDIKLGLYGDVVWRTQQVDTMKKGIAPELGVFMWKKLTLNTGTGFWLGWTPQEKVPLIGWQLNFQF